MATLTCVKCGWTMDTTAIDLQKIPGPDRCTQVYNATSGFPADKSNATHHISGPCNGKLNRS